MRYATRDLRLMLQMVQRSGGNPNHGADGKFSSGGGGTEHTYTPAERLDRINEAVPVGVTIYQDGETKEFLNGPWKGRTLGFDYTDAEMAGRNISHSFATFKNFMKHTATIYISTWMKQGMTRKAARARAVALWHAKSAAINPPIPMKDAMSTQVPPRPPDTARLQEAARIVRLLDAQVARKVVPLFAIGADGKNHFAGSLPGPNSTGKSNGLGLHSGVAFKGGSGRSGGAKPTETIHERAARLQQEQGLKPEALPSPTGENLYPISDRVGHQFNVYIQPDAKKLVSIFGEHQLGAALTLFTPDKLNQTAKDVGVKPGKSKAETVSRIVAHVTQGRYSANFPKVAPVPKAPAAPKTTVSAAQHAKLQAAHAAALARIAELEARLAKLEAGQAGAKPRTSRKPTSKVPQDGTQP